MTSHVWHHLLLRMLRKLRDACFLLATAPPSGPEVSYYGRKVGLRQRSIDWLLNAYVNARIREAGVMAEFRPYTPTGDPDRWHSWIHQCQNVSDFRPTVDPVQDECECIFCGASDHRWVQIWRKVA